MTTLKVSFYHDAFKDQFGACRHLRIWRALVRLTVSVSGLAPRQTHTQNEGN